MMVATPTVDVRQVIHISTYHAYTKSTGEGIATQGLQ